MNLTHMQDESSWLPLKREDSTFFLKLMQQSSEGLRNMILSYLTFYNLGNKELEDIYDLTFLSAIQNIEKLRASPNPVGWLYRAARFHISHLRRAENRLVRFPDLHAPLSTEENFDLSLSEILPNNLKADDVQLLTLRYTYRLSIRDIAEQLSLSEDSVKQRLKRLRDRLREGLNDDS